MLQSGRRRKSSTRTRWPLVKLQWCRMSLTKLSKDPDLNCSRCSLEISRHRARRISKSSAHRNWTFRIRATALDCRCLSCLRTWENRLSLQKRRKRSYQWLSTMRCWRSKLLKTSTKPRAWMRWWNLWNSLSPLKPRQSGTSQLWLRVKNLWQESLQWTIRFRSQLRRTRCPPTWAFKNKIETQFPTVISCYW